MKSFNINPKTILITLLHLAMSVLGYLKFPGHLPSYVVFSAAFLLLIIRAISSKKSPSILFFGIMLWLGFFAKTVLHLYLKTPFLEPVGNFNYSPEHWDHVLLVAAIGAFGGSLATFLPGKWVKLKLPKTVLQFNNSQKNIFPFRKYRFYIYAFFLAALMGVSIVNVTLGINLSGMVAKTVLPFHLNAAIAWLLYVGFSLLAAQICYWEYLEFKKHRWGFWLFVIEAVAVSIAIFSRGFLIFHLAPLLYFNFVARRHFNLNKLSLVFRTIVVGIAAVLNILCINSIRSTVFDEGTTIFDVYDVYDKDVYLFEAYELNLTPKTEPIAPEENLATAATPAPEVPATNQVATAEVSPQQNPPLPTPAPESTPTSTEPSALAEKGEIVKQFVLQHFTQVSSLVVDRWVGIEGAMAVSSYPDKNLQLMKDCFFQKPAIGEVDIYNSIAKSGYSPSFKYSFSSIPGPIAFFYYSGEIGIVFLGIFGFFAALIILDQLIFRFFANPFLSVIMAFYFAISLAQFGLAPRQLGISFFMTFIGLSFLYLLNRVLASIFKKSQET